MIKHVNDGKRAKGNCLQLHLQQKTNLCFLSAFPEENGWYYKGIVCADNSRELSSLIWALMGETCLQGLRTIKAQVSLCIPTD